MYLSVKIYPNNLLGNSSYSFVTDLSLCRIEWKSLDHPSIDGKAIAKIVKVEIAGDEKRITDC